MTDYPPYVFLVKCFDECPACILTYVILWKSTHQNLVYALKMHIQDDYLTHPGDFLEQISMLRDANLLKFIDKEDAYIIQIEADEISAAGLALC